MELQIPHCAVSYTHLDVYKRQAQDTVIVQAVAVGQLTVCNIIKQYLILVRMCVEARVRANEAVVQRLSLIHI